MKMGSRKSCFSKASFSRYPPRISLLGLRTEWAAIRLPGPLDPGAQEAGGEVGGLLGGGGALDRMFGIGSTQ